MPDEDGAVEQIGGFRLDEQIGGLRLDDYVSDPNIWGFVNKYIESAMGKTRRRRQAGDER